MVQIAQMVPSFFREGGLNMTDIFNADEVVKTSLTEAEQVEAQKAEKIVDDGLAG